MVNLQFSDMNNKFDPTKPVRTRDGRQVRILCTDRAGDKPIVALLLKEGCEYLRSYFADGTYTGVPGYRNQHSLDLVNIPKKIQRTFWLNFYPEGSDAVCHRSKEAADISALDYRIACIPVNVEFEEGQGL